MTEHCPPAGNVRPGGRTGLSHDGEAAENVWRLGKHVLSVSRMLSPKCGGQRSAVAVAAACFVLLLLAAMSVSRL